MCHAQGRSVQLPEKKKILEEAKVSYHFHIDQQMILSIHPVVPLEKNSQCRKGPQPDHLNPMKVTSYKLQEQIENNLSSPSSAYVDEELKIMSYWHQNYSPIYSYHALG